MSQDDLILLLFKISTISIILSIALFIGVYTRLAPWWKSPIGRTLVWKDALLAIVLIPTVISLFFKLNRMTSHLIAWFDIGDFFLITGVLLVRCRLWFNIHKGGRTPNGGDDHPADARP